MKLSQQVYYQPVDLKHENFNKVVTLLDIEPRTQGIIYGASQNVQFYISNAKIGDIFQYKQENSYPTPTQLS